MLDNDPARKPEAATCSAGARVGGDSRDRAHCLGGARTRGAVSNGL